MFLVKFDLILLCKRANMRDRMVLMFEFLVKVLVGELQREGLSLCRIRQPQGSHLGDPSCYSFLL